jgi:DNA polymerase III delta prime subunit
MLTKEAFNALLKTIEEPPPNVKFFFATIAVRLIPAGLQGATWYIRTDWFYCTKLPCISGRVVCARSRWKPEYKRIIIFHYNIYIYLTINKLN